MIFCELYRSNCGMHESAVSCHVDCHRVSRKILFCLLKYMTFSLLQCRNLEITTRLFLLLRLALSITFGVATSLWARRLMSLSLVMLTVEDSAMLLLSLEGLQAISWRNRYNDGLQVMMIMRSRIWLLDMVMSNSQRLQSFIFPCCGHGWHGPEAHHHHHEAEDALRWKLMSLIYKCLSIFRYLMISLVALVHFNTQRWQECL